MFQEHFLLPQCSVLENVLTPTLVADGHEAYEARARELLGRVGLGRASRPPAGRAVGGREAAGGAGPRPGPEAGAGPVRRAHRQPRRGLGRSRGRPAARAALRRAGHPDPRHPQRGPRRALRRPTPSRGRAPRGRVMRRRTLLARSLQPLLAFQRRGGARGGGGRGRARGLAGGGRLGARQPRRDGALARLGRTTHAVEGAGFFRADLAGDLEARERLRCRLRRPRARSWPCGAWPPTPRAAAGPATCGSTASTSASGRSRDWQPPALGGREALVSAPLADELGAGAGDAILVRLHAAADVPGEHALRTARRPRPGSPPHGEGGASPRRSRRAVAAAPGRRGACGLRAPRHPPAQRGAGRSAPTCCWSRPGTRTRRRPRWRRRSPARSTLRGPGPAPARA